MKPPESRRKGRPKGFDSKPSQNTIQSLDRALEVLDTIALANGLSLTELANRLDQSPATMYRVLSTLEAREFVEIDPLNQTWHIGPMAFRLGSAFLRRSSVAERSRPAMRALMTASGETSNLGVQKQGDVMFIGQVETHETIRAFFPPGTLSPMPASGIGKALLSRLSDDALDRFLKSYPMVRFTEKTIMEPEALKAELSAIRNRGYAFDDEEKTLGMRCVAAPILNIYGEAVAGLSLSGPTLRMPPDRIAALGTLVKDAADKVSRSLGAPGETAR
ncbi:IclR family transcriptional regulator [Sedimentitalea sp. JM2-8]|uniref:IclR family transcriptional regulator n=1 Tax=Sedimentitalea xiamensis TaxID=3050037 RepID=A0ABT7FKU7_9RHOB|nr:HTH-type transcriptional regulator BhcR [Sedimentitalea xiamensis]MDK3075772.1 IclR family transcriptional regulator [Sedimentitalea xiamensis]